MYQEDYFKFHLREKQDYYDFFSNKGVDLEEYLIKMLGDVTGLKLLDTCCACDAIQAFSWHNLGAKVTACDISPKAIEIAKKSAEKMNLDVSFAECDMQLLDVIDDCSFDIVFSTYPYWIQDINEACRNWYRVLKEKGRLLLTCEHPFTQCFEEENDMLSAARNYNMPGEDFSETFNGTPLSDSYGGWSADVPAVGHVYRVSDLINAVCAAGFRITESYESSCADYSFREEKTNSVLNNLPRDFALSAIKE